MRIGVLGLGAVGARAGAAGRRRVPAVSEVLVSDVDRARADRVARVMGVDVVASTPDALFAVDTVIIATPAPHARAAAGFLEHGVDVVSVSDDLADVRALIALDHTARRAERTWWPEPASLPVSSTCSPASWRAGSTPSTRSTWPSTAPGDRRAPASTTSPSGAGPCSGTTASGSSARPARGGNCAGSPTPSAPWDCYVRRAGRAAPARAVVPGRRAGARRRLSATRRDRVTARFPMLRPPHAEGGLSGVRIEVRGTRGGGPRRRDRRARSTGRHRRRARWPRWRPCASPAPTAPARRPRAPGRRPTRSSTSLLAELARRGIRGAEFIGRDPSSACNAVIM